LKKEQHKLERILGMGFIAILTISAFLPLCKSDFILPPQGGGIVHCDLQMSENINLSPPINNTGIVWYSHLIGGELFGTWGNGIAGNGNISACTFNNYFGNDNLIIYDYYGNRLWSSGDWNVVNPEFNWSLNYAACGSSPMVDIKDRVIACDNRHVILVNATNHSNIHVNWTSDIPHTLPFIPYPISPSIVENKTIILPTSYGPLIAYNVENGSEIAEMKLGQNGVSHSYYGIPDMSELNFTSIISNPFYCPYHYNNQNHLIEWESDIPYGIMPSNYIFHEDNVIFIQSPDGNVTAIDNTTDEVLTSNAVAEPQLLQGLDYYSTVNSACVQGQRIFLATEKKGEVGRLYAVDVFPDEPNQEDRLQVAWCYNYSKKSEKSQATPTLIGDALYFDGYNKSWNNSKRDPHIYAVYAANGTEKWNRSYDNITWFTFTTDPRGGFWYEDCDQVQPSNNTGGNKLVRFSEDDGHEIEEIDMKTLLNDTGPKGDSPVMPSSDMTICGNATNPIMLISANHQWRKEGKWVLAVKLQYNENISNNTLLWKIPLNETILSGLKQDQSRVTQ